MNSIPDDELLSAYLDGELSEEERARVEQMLAERPEARQLLDELRALSGGFEALPRHRLEADFAPRVLRAAEREMLTDDPPGETPAAPPQSAAIFSSDAAASAARDHAVRPAARQAHQFDWKRWRRPLAWAGAAMAAGLLLMVMERGRQGVAPIGQVAHAPNAGVEFRAADEAPPAEARDRRAGSGDFEGDTESFSVQTAPAEGMEGEPLGAEGARRESDGLGRRNAPGEPAHNAKAAAEPPLPALAAPGPRGAAPAKASSPLQAGGMLGGEGPKTKLRARALAETDGRNAYDADDANWFRFGVERKEGDKIVSEPLDPKTLIVWCDVEESVASRPEFRQLLTSNGIVWEPGAPPVEADQKIEGEKRSTRPGERAKDESKKLDDKTESAEPPLRKENALQDKAEKDESGREAAGRVKAGRVKAGLAPSRSNLERRSSSLSADQSQPESEALARERSLNRFQTVAEALNESSADYVLLEASEEQLKAVLTEFDRHPEMFITVNIEPAPEAPSQQAFYAYNRGRVATDVAKPAESGSSVLGQKTASGSDEKQQLGKKSRAGRAQQVQILPQQLEDSVELQMATDEADLAPEAKEKATEDSSDKKASSGKLEKRTAAGVELKARAEGAAVGQKPASAGAETKSRASSSEGTAPRDYQQALIILRRVPAAAAAPEGKEEPKPPASKEGDQQDK
ncbi:MAG TPA: zf-HC2 domain-containing protein [Pirellulales bacterium]|nr:zf-HC2 domain-containing protein [Pirellulales bacterium]